MHIVNFSVKKLFGLYTYIINFTKLKNNLCILTGPNGYGKTTVLQIIDCLSEVDLFFFYTFPFERIELQFDNNESIEINQVVPEEQEGIDTDEDSNLLSNKLHFVYKDKNKQQINYFILSYDKLYETLSFQEKRELNEISVNSVSLKEKWKFFKNKTNSYEQIAQSQGQEQFLFFLKRINSFFIPAQRLSFEEIPENIYSNRFPKIKNQSAIDYVVKNLKKILNKNKMIFLDNSQIHDNNFVQRFISSNYKGYSELQYKKKVKLLQKRLSELKSFNLIQPSDFFQYKREYKKILSVYIDDFEEKLDAYNDIVEKLRLFSEVLAEKSFSNKVISFSPERGLYVQDSNGNFLDNNVLSSGEQNEIIMLYHFIFDLNADSLLLIDEPEISLHVAWQLSFLDDIEKIIKTKKIQVILATHSPQIINNKWDNCFDFYEQTEKRHKNRL